MTLKRRLVMAMTVLLSLVAADAAVGGILGEYAMTGTAPVQMP